MKTAVLCFSPQGAALAKKYFSQEDCYGKDFQRPIKKEDFGTVFNTYDRIVFIGAAGIAVRYMAPFVADKRKDPAVVVIDPVGRYVIPLLSGHLGGANAYAEELAKAMGAEAVLTTASDSLGFEAIDTFAQRENYAFENMGAMKEVAATMVAGREILWFSEEDALPDYPHIVRVASIEAADVKGGVVVTTKDVEIRSGLQLVPRRIHLGIGSKKGTDPETLVALIKKTLKTYAIHPMALAAVHTIDIKKEEPAIVYAAKAFGVPLKIYTAEELSRYEDRCKGSDFVRATVGVSSVSCTAAYMGGEITIAEKIREEGFTLSITEEKR